MRCCTYLRVSRKDQDNGVALERMLFDAQKAIEALGGTLEPEMVFIDLISGRKNDRPDFSAIWELIESKSVDVVVFNRVDRLGRDAELLLKLGKLFESTGVKAYVCEKNKFINWSDLDDWDYWTRSSVNAEMESRVISSRGLKAHEFTRHKKQAAWVSPFGYRRSEDRLYEFDPEEYPVALKMIEIIEEERGNTKKACTRILDELGQPWTGFGLRNWIRNPTLRGHTPYGYSKRVKAETVYNTHSGLDNEGNYNPDKDFRLLTEERYQEIEQRLKDRSTYRGINANKEHYPLTGLLKCACGSDCSIQKSTCRKPGKSYGKEYTYIRCRAGEECWREYPKHPKMSIKYELVEKAVIEYLASQATLLINAVEKTTPKTLPVKPEILKRQAHIQHLQQGIAMYGDANGDQGRTIARLRVEISELSKENTDSIANKELRNRLKNLSNEDTWYALSNSDLRSFFIAFIQHSLINFEQRKVAIHLDPLLHLGSNGTVERFYHESDS